MAGTEVIKPKQERSRMRVTALLDAAEELVEKLGVEGFAMSEVARRAGAAHGSLYRYFASREALLAALHERQLSQLEAAVVEASEKLSLTLVAPTAREFLDAFLDPLRDFLIRNRSYRLLRIGMPGAWQVASSEAELDARVVDELARALRKLVPGLEESRRVLAATLLLSLTDSTIIIEERPEVQREGRHVLELYLEDLVSNVSCEPSRTGGTTS